ncbi:MAG: hypothetical protein ACYS17_00450 [Planctomycetota bacterium]|jgi:hypothetical protein
MYCAKGVVISKKAASFCADSYPYFSAIKHFYKDNNPKMPGFWRAAKAAHY